MGRRSRRAFLQATAAVMVSGTLAGCVGPAVDSLRDNCTEDERTDGPASADGSGRWAEYGAGPRNTASTTATGPVDPELAWRYATCAGRLANASPLVADGTVYVTDAVSGVQAFDAATGERLWSDDATGRPPRQSYADGTLFVVQNGLLARDGRDGSIGWTLAPEDASTPDGDGQSRTVAAPTVADGTVFVVAGVGEARLLALDATDGSVLWNEQISDELRSPAPTVGPDAVYIAGTESELLVFDRETGAVRWTTEFEGRVETTMVANDRLYVVTQSVLHALSRDGDTDYTIPAGAGDAWDPAVDAERLYVADASVLAAFDVETGETLWETGNVDDDGETRNLGKPVVGESSVYVGQVDPSSGDGDPQAAIHAFDKESGDRRWRFDTRGIGSENGGPNLGTEEQIAIGDETLYFTTGAGDLYAVTDG